MTYQQLVFQFFQTQGNGCLVTRVRTLSINEEGCVFLDEQHQRRVSEQLTANIQRGILVLAGGAFSAGIEVSPMELGHFVLWE